VTGADRPPAAPGRPVVIWHHQPGGRARATALTHAASTLARPVLARLIATRVLGDPDASVTIDHVLTRPPGSPVLPAGQEPLDTDETAEEPGEPVPEVADPATGTVRQMSRRCDTCIYRRSMRTVLGTSVAALIRQARASGGFVICHESTPAWQTGVPVIPAAICHGYATAYPDTFALRAARAFGRIEPVDPVPAAPRPTEPESAPGT
jgi:hypothetical protein